MDGNPDDNFSLSSVFSQSYFIIPDYQRDYAWETSHVNDLLEDIEFIYKQNQNNGDGEKVSHYFGTVVLEERESVEPTDFEDYTKFAIVDGQQRLATITIVISTIIEEMKSIVSDDISDNMISDINERSDDIRNSYVEYENIPRLRLGGLAEDVYKKTIIDGQKINEVSQNSDLVETERRILNTKKSTISKISEWKNEKCNGGENPASYYKFLKKIIGIMTNRFEVNVKVVEDVDEAARMFKVINNRGRGLNLHDKVRSHLVYCASQSHDIKSKRIYTIFNNIIRNITIHDGFSDADIDKLVRLHWAVFTSERSDTRSKRKGPIKIHRRLSDLDDYASVQRDSFEKFIKPYVKSLENFSKHYPYLTDRDKFAEKYSSKSNTKDNILGETSKKIQLLFMRPAQTGVAPLLIAAAEKFGVGSEEFANLTSELEKLVFRYSLVMSNGHNRYSNMLQSIANDLYWSDISDKNIERIFESDSQRYCGYQSKELGITKAVDRIVKKRERMASIDDVISEYLSEGDILDGEFTSGWGGIRNNEVVKYIMYEYEWSLRQKSGRLSLSPYHEFRRNFQVEHLVPKNAEVGHKLDNHEQNKNRIGNLAILSSEENNEKNNQPYKNKYHSIYKRSSLKVLRDLNEDKFTINNIEHREEKIFSFIRSRWG